MNKIRSILTLAVLLPLFAWTETPPLEPAGPPGPAEPAEPPAPPPPGKEKVPPPRRGPAERFNWRAFSRLTEAERTELFKLQRSDPDKFREELRRRGEELRRQEIARMEELRQLVEKCKAATGAERTELRGKLVAHLRADYLERLEDNRRQLEEMKRHAKRLEKELDKRAAKVDEAVEAQAELFLNSSEFPPPPPRPGKKHDK